MTEILNSIWTALSTENEGLIYLFGLLCIPLEITLNMLVFTTILNIKTNKRQKILYITIFSSIAIILYIFIPAPLNAFINMLILPILVFIIFKANILKSIIAEFIPTIIIVLIEALIAKIIFVFFKIPYDTLAIIPISRFLIVAVIYLTLLTVYYIFKAYSINISSFDDLDKKSRIILIINSTVGLLTIATQFYLSSFYNENLPMGITFLSLLTLIAFFIINIFSLISVIKLKNTTQNLEESQLYNKTLQILHDNVRAFRHDFSNIVTAIGGYVGAEDMNGLKKYYSQLLVDCQRTNNLTTLCPEVINNPAIYNVLANKYHRADEKGIKIELSIFYDFNKLNIKIYELTRILGILLDNAIEASGECEIKNINVTLRDEPNKNRKVILIENTYNNKNVDTETIYEKGYSSKEGNTGLGLWQVRQILNKNTNLNLYTYKNEDYFCQQLEMYN